MKFIITVDTEGDNQWKKERPITLRNIKYLPRFHALCLKYNFKPTYLVTYDVANDQESAEILLKWQKADEAEIGAHLHPWTTPPYSEFDAIKQRYPSELDDKELEEKLTNLTIAIQKNFGSLPKSYRAGRWGIDSRQIKILKSLGYDIDCSITPKINWKKINNDNRAPDFTFAKVGPYEMAADDILEAGVSGILELPMTIVFTGLFNRENSKLIRWFLKVKPSLVKKILNKLLFDLKWLRIFPNTTKSDWLKIYNSAIKNNLSVLEFMVHSSELMPGASPYVKTEQDVEKLYYNLESLFAFFKNSNIKGKTLNEYYELIKGK